ncbi:MAG: EcsC family protein [Deltaproteobacteria bacterium]|nr:EcsC family protein [Deltaproteobacteria bacterium]
MKSPFSGGSFGTSEQIKQSIKLLNQLLDYGIEGFGPICGAKKLAEGYTVNADHKNKLASIEALIKKEELKNFTSGFLTSVGGIITLPVTIPASIGINWILQIRMVAAMAYIGGFDIDEPGVRITIALCILGKKGKEIINAHPSEIAGLLQTGGITHFPRNTILILNQTIAMRLMRVATQKGFTRLSKAIPLLGGLVGGALDYHSCHETSQFAKELFQFELTNEDEISSISDK